MILIPKFLADFGLNLNKKYYHRLFISKYVKNANSPSWFDHRIDLYYNWPNNLFWLERGILPRKYMFQGCKILDLFCGDGYYSRYFHSTIAGKIDAIDKDQRAIAHAKKHHSHPLINFAQIDVIKENLPGTNYDLILWYEAIEHLSENDYSNVIYKIKTSLSEDGILFGSTPIIKEENLGKNNWEHENEFTSVNQLNHFLSKDFHEISIYTTEYPEGGGKIRKTAYFSCRLPIC